MTAQCEPNREIRFAQRVGFPAVNLPGQPERFHPFEILIWRWNPLSRRPLWQSEKTKSIEILHGANPAVQRKEVFPLRN